MGFGRRDKRVDMDVVGSTGWVVGWVRQDLSSVEHGEDFPHMGMSKGLGMALGVSGAACRMERCHTGPIDGSKLRIKIKVDGVINRCNDTTSWSVKGRTLHMFVVLMLKPFSRMSCVNLGAMVSNQCNLLKFVVKDREWHAVKRLVGW